jgi:2-oxoglutarate dehydrogenase E2 component (dihydrolipoamide succinyltransferase)
VARIDVIMPQMGESIAEGTLSKWLKKVGDEVKRDEPLFEISTDKVDAEIPSAAAGVLAEILVTEGQTVAVQTVVARLETEKGAAVSSAPSGSSSGAATSGNGATVGAGAPPQKQNTAVSAGASQRSAAPVAASTQPSSSMAQSAPANSFEDRLRTKSSPLVRKIAAEHGIEISALSGTGIAGRVTKRDLDQHLQTGAPMSGISAGHAPSFSRESHGPVPTPWPGDRVEVMSKMRALISDHMVASRRTSAHVTSFFEVDLTRVARIRAQLRAQFEAQTGQKLTFLPFIIKAVAQGLRKFPMLNASVAGTSIIYRKNVNIGVAVALDWGLIVPVIKGADDLSLGGLTKTLNDLAARARAKKLAPAEVQEGTFTITNPGVFGSLMGTPIINQPQVAIMGVGAIEKRAKVITGADGEDTIAIRTCAYFSISFDHRIVDGADADKFMAYIKQYIETYPETSA